MSARGSSDSSQQQSPARRRFVRLLPFLLLFAAVGISGSAVFALILGIKDKPQTQAKQPVQMVKIVRPPPPPPPKVEEEPPPEPEIEEEVPEEPEIEEEIPDMPEAPPAEALGLDAEGGAGSDAFGLLGRKGAAGLLEGRGGSFLAWYGGQIKNQLASHLSRREKVRSKSYSVIVKVWISDDGTVERIDLVDSTGDVELDGELRLALADIDKVPEPPDEFANPVKLRIVSRL